MGVITTGQTFSSGDQVTSTKLNDIGNQATFTSAADTTDDSTLTLSGGKIKVKDNGITSTQLKSDASTDSNRAVQTNHIRDGQITTAKIADNAVSADNLSHTAVTAGSYTNTSLTVDAQGRLTAASNGSSIVQYISAQGSPTSTALGASDTIVGAVSLSLPSGKTWDWIKVVCTMGIDSSGGIASVKIKEGSSTLSWVTNAQALTTHNSDNRTFPTFIFEGVPTGTSTTPITFNVTAQQSSSGVTDTPTYRRIYAVGQCS